MTDAPVNPRPAYRDNPIAPVVYFDGAPFFGVLSGAIQVELAGRTITGTPEGTTSEFVTMGRLRCSPAAAIDLRDALTKALEMLQQIQDAPQGAPQGSAIN
jgi:hypothetical protein